MGIGVGVGVAVGIGVDVGILVGVGEGGLGVGVGVAVAVTKGVGVDVFVGAGVDVTDGFKVMDASVRLIVGVKLSSVTTCISDLRNVNEVMSLGVADTFAKLKLANSITPVGRV